MNAQQEAQAFAQDLSPMVTQGLPLQTTSHYYLITYVSLIVVDVIMFTICAVELARRHYSGQDGGFFTVIRDPETNAKIWLPNSTKHWLFWSMIYCIPSLALNVAYIVCLYGISFEALYFEPLRDCYL